MDGIVNVLNTKFFSKHPIMEGFIQITSVKFGLVGNIDKVELSWNL